MTDKIHINELKDGDILVWTVDFGFSVVSLMSMGVALFTLSKYTHVGIVRIIDGKVHILEAQYPKVRLIEALPELPFKVISIDKPVNDKALEYIDKKIGKDYSIWQAIVSVFGIYVDDTEWYCTEIGYAFLEKISISIPKKLKPGTFVKNLQRELNTNIKDVYF